MTSNMKDWALWYVQAHGLAVFPLPPNKKAPGHLGIKSATRDLAQIASWWGVEPMANIGVLGCLRIDIDPKNGGDAAWAALIKQHGDPRTLRVTTPSTGEHYYFRADANVGNSRGLLPKGIDVRGADTGYTVAPPSTTIEIPNKQRAGRYELRDASAPIAPCPQWLLDLLAGVERAALEKTEPLRSDITTDQFNDLRSALMSPEILSDWERWSDFGYALLGLGDAGRQLFFEYSAAQRATLPEKAVFETEEVWWRNHRNSSPRSDYRSIFSRAQALGWKNPKSVDTSKLGFGQSPLPAGVTPTPSPHRKFEIKNGWEFANAPGIQWRVDKILPQQGVAVVYGAPAVGKSFMMIDLLMSIVRGVPYGYDQFKTEQAAALYVLAEGAAGVKQRLRAYQQANELGRETPSIHVISEAPNLFDSEDTQALINAIVPTGAKVAAVDTLAASMMGGDENATKDMGIVLGNCRKLATAINGLVILVHHVGKDADRGERGNSSIRGNSDTMIELKLLDDGLRVAKISKQRDGDDNVSWQFRLQPRVVAGPAGMEESAIVSHVPTQAAAAKKVVEKGGTTEDAVRALLAGQAGVQSEEGMPFEHVIANIMVLRPDLPPSKVRNIVSNAISSGQYIYVDGESVRAVK